MFNCKVFDYATSEIYIRFGSKLVLGTACRSISALQSRARVDGSDAHSLVRHIVQEVMVLLLNVPDDGEVAGSSKRQASGPLIIDLQEQIIGRKNKIHTLKLERDGGESRIRDPRQIVAEVEPNLGAVDLSILNKRLQLRQERNVSRLDELRDGGPRVQNHTSLARQNIERESAGPNSRHRLIIHQNPIQLHVVKRIGRRVADQRSVFHLHLQTVASGLCSISENQRTRLRGRAESVDQTVGEFRPDQRSDLLVEGDGTAAQTDQSIGTGERALVSFPTAECEVGDRLSGAICGGEGQSVEGEVSLGGGLISIAVAVRAVAPVVGDLRQVAAERAEVADFLVGRGLPRVEEWIRLLVANRARSALQPYEVTSSVGDGGPRLRGRS
ncbi:hypothetical protein Mapa_000762 [Marchantia paleacea]|nr:hypothetical protein Mapa_000762 [Marchantia paleacea]